MEEWKEYITIESVTLLVAIATLVVTIITYISSRKSEKKKMKKLIASKEAYLKAIEDSMNMGIVDSEAGRLSIKKAGLQAELEELKSEL
jgi:hypothetical protein